MANPLVSIILPTFNGGPDLRRLLPRLAEQDFGGGTEICAVDSSSSDDTRALLEAAGATVETIDPSGFRHGLTRNRCSERARGEYLVFLSQDAEPVDEQFLRTLIAAFDDPRVAGACSRVIPRPDDDPLTARTVLELPEASDREIVRDLDAVDGLWNLEAEERVRYLRFNNVASAIRASVFREIPFPDLAFGEDFAWAARALTAGHRIRFVPRSLVYHAHSYGMGKVFERYRTDAAFHREIHGHLVRPTAASVARGFLYEVREDMRYIKQSTRRGHRAASVLRSPWLRAAQVFGQYCGSRGLAGSSLET